MVRLRLLYMAYYGMWLFSFKNDMLMKNELNLEESKIYLRAKRIGVPVIITTIYSFVIRGLEEFLDYFYSLPNS